MKRRNIEPTPLHLVRSEAATLMASETRGTETQVRVWGPDPALCWTIRLLMLASGGLAAIVGYPIFCRLVPHWIAAALSLLLVIAGGLSALCLFRPGSIVVTDARGIAVRTRRRSDTLPWMEVQGAHLDGDSLSPCHSLTLEASGPIQIDLPGYTLRARESLLNQITEAAHLVQCSASPAVFHRAVVDTPEPETTKVI